MTLLANNGVLAALRSGGPTQTLATALGRGSTSNVFNVADYGVLTQDSSAAATVNTNTFIAACDAVEAAGGGTLYVPPGTYYVGKQDASAGNDTLGYSYRGYTIIKIDNCTKPVQVILSGVKLIFVAGLRYGSFDPLTGLAMATKQTASKYKAYTGNFIQMYNNTSVVEVVGPCEMDGNNLNFELGSEWGDTGHQLESDGIEIRNSPIQSIRDIYAHHMGRDGFHTSYFWSQTRQHGQTLLENCTGNFNGRDGWSIIGGNKVMGLNCEFSWQGKSSVDYTTATLSSSPNSGIDIENEVEAIRNVTLINVRCVGNTNHGIVSDSGDTESVHLHGCTLVGEDTVLWAGTRAWTLYDSKVIGKVDDLIGATKGDTAFKAFNTLFSTSLADYNTSGDYPQITWSVPGGTSQLTGWRCVFENCTFRAGGQMPGFNPGTGNATLLARFHNCNIEQEAGNSNTMHGIYTGRTYLSHVLNNSFSIGNGRNEGTFIVSNTATGESNAVYGGGCVIALTANHTIRAYANGTTYTNEGATALRTHTLPTAVANLEYSFYIHNTFGIKIAAASGDTIAIGTSVTAAAGNIQSTVVGSRITLRAINATEWVAIESFGSWNLAAATATVDPASLATASRTTPATITVSGAALGDIVDASFSLDLQAVELVAYVSAANTVTYYFENNSGGLVDLGSGTLKVYVRK